MKILPLVSLTPSASARCRFLELRSQGKTYDQIASDLGVSRRTLFYWNKELQEELAFEETAELETLHQELLGTREARARRLAKRLAAIEDELDKRSLADLSTARLYTLADSLRRQLTKEITPQRPGRANFPVSPDQKSHLESANSAIPVQPILGRANLPLSPDQTPPLPAPSTQESTPSTNDIQPSTFAPQCNDSAITVQPENNTPSPLPKGEKDGMRGPSARPASASSFLDSPIQEPSPSTRNTQPSTFAPQCNDSAIPVQPEHNTPSPLPKGEKDGMRGPSARPAFASSFVGSPIPEPSNSSIQPSPQYHESAIAVQPIPGRANLRVSPDQITPSESTQSPKNVQPASDDSWKSTLFATYDAGLTTPIATHPSLQCNGSAKPVQCVSGLSTKDTEPSTSHEEPSIPSSNNPPTQSSNYSHIQPISPERLIGPNINFREVLEKRRQAELSSATS